ncbi:MAG: Spore protein SP21 [Dehalococcoidia bacterium]|nr:Spore protein SP21 [Chloroflexota bacterium]
MVLERWRPQWQITPWRPFRDVEDIERQLGGIFGRVLSPTVWRRFPLEGMGWVPPIDMFEKEDKLVVKAELPGINEEDIDVSVLGDTLTIRGERKAETEVSERDYQCCERSYGSFTRSIVLPSSVDAAKIEASYEDGVLEVILPKAPEVGAKKISISSKGKEESS